MPQNFIHVSQLPDVPERRPTFLAIGVFDGVHRGHQQLLRQMATEARTAGAQAAVLTFFPHPGIVLGHRQGRLYLTPLQRRVELLARQGIELVISHPFNEEVRQTRAADFVAKINRHLDLRQLWGGSFSLGYNREGDLDFLTRLGRERGFSVRYYKALERWKGEPISSSRVRRSLREGAIEDVIGCLGRAYQLQGRVIRGDGRGRTIGVPTANLDIWEEQVLPANGVYAAYAYLDGERYAAATNVGVRPTVNGQSLSVEAHLLDFSADIYDQNLTLEFIRRVRDEQKFSGLDALVAQIKADIAQVGQLLSN